MNDTDPIEVSASPLIDQLWAGVRQVAPAMMAFSLGKGWLADDVAVLLGVIGGVVWPIVAGQLRTRERSKLIVTLTNAAPDTVAVLK